MTNSSSSTGRTVLKWKKNSVWRMTFNGGGGGGVLRRNAHKHWHNDVTRRWLASSFSLSLSQTNTAVEHTAGILFSNVSAAAVLVFSPHSSLIRSTLFLALLLLLLLLLLFCFSSSSSSTLYVISVIQGSWQLIKAEKTAWRWPELGKKVSFCFSYVCLWS